MRDRQFFSTKQNPTSQKLPGMVADRYETHNFTVLRKSCENSLNSPAEFCGFVKLHSTLSPIVGNSSVVFPEVRISDARISTKRGESCDFLPTFRRLSSDREIEPRDLWHYGTECALYEAKTIT